MGTGNGGVQLVLAAGEESANEGHPAEGEAPQQKGSRLFVGPGFELVVRAGENRPFDVTLNPSRRPPERPRKATGDHDHPDIELRMKTVEATLANLLRQLDTLNEQVERAMQAARAAPPTK